ncbi:MAG: hypothetical protein K2O88_01575 [Paramuribaculum sp.]|nr:hypothetical protein [Paramuribaculum sp.]
MTIAVDFDGTIVEHRYPEIGREIPNAVRTLKRMQDEMPDLRMILWTVREGELLDQAVQWCRERGLEFYAVNSNYIDDDPMDQSATGRKVTADIYIDDRNLGGLPDWNSIYVMVTKGWSMRRLIAETTRTAAVSKQEPWWKRLFS